METAAQNCHFERKEGRGCDNKITAIDRILATIMDGMENYFQMTAVNDPSGNVGFNM
jgi:hypothetical protein